MGYAAELPSAGDRTRTLFGRVMALVALTVAFATLGVYAAREMGGAEWFVAWLLALGCLVGLNLANARGNQGLALVLLCAFGLLIGVSVSATALFVGGLGAGGYAIRRDLSFVYRFLFFALLALIVAGIVLIFVRIQALYTAYALIGLAIFGGYTIVDFNRLRRAGGEEAIPLAAGIFLDVFNVFLLFLRLFAQR